MAPRKARAGVKKTWAEDAGGCSKRSGRSASSRPSDAELQDMIEQRAYQLFEKRGYLGGDDQKDWFEAERIVRRQYNIT